MDKCSPDSTSKIQIEVNCQKKSQRFKVTESPFYRPRPSQIHDINNLNPHDQDPKHPNNERQ